MVLEYEEVAKRQLRTLGLSSEEPDDIIDYICSVANRRRIFFLWCPYLRDPKDDMVLELAVEARCYYIVSYNKRHFAGVEKFGLRVLTPQEFLRDWRDRMSTLSLRFPESLHKQLKELAKQEGVSINQLAVTALAEKMSALMTGEYLEERAQRGSRRKFEDALDRIKDAKPDQQDEL